MSGVQIIEGLSHEQYIEIDAEHSGALRKIMTSPLAYRRHVDTPDSDRDVLRLGRAVHTAVLEPHLFRSRYVCWSGGTRRGKVWDAYVAEAANAGQTILKADQIDLAVRISKAARSHPISGPILSEDGRAEVTIVWPHPCGITIKVRVDWLTDTAVVDLKSCRDPAPGRFCTQAAQLGYHFQLALYADAVAAAGLGALGVKIIAAQSTEPHDVVGYALDENTLMLGREQYESALSILQECRDKDEWPGQAETEELPLRLPAWATPTDDLELTMGGEVLSWQ